MCVVLVWGGGVFKYFPYSILCLLFVAVEWILLKHLAPKYDFIPYRPTYFCGVICVSINTLCAWALGHLKPAYAYWSFRLSCCSWQSFLRCASLYFLNFTMTSLAGVIVVLGNDVSLSLLEGLVHSEYERHARSKLGQHNYIFCVNCVQGVNSKMRWNEGTMAL